MTATSRPIGSSTSCAMSWGCWTGSAARKLRCWPATISAHRSPHGAALIRPDIFHKLALMSASFPGPAGHLAATATRAVDPCRTRGTRLASQALSVVLLDTAGEYGDAGLPPGSPCLPAGLPSTTRAPTGPETGPSGWRPGAPKSWPGCRPTTSWTATGRWRRRWRRRCPAKRKQPRAAGCRMQSSRSMHGNTSATVFRAGCNGIGAGRAGGSTGSTSCSPGRRIEVPACFISGAADWGIYQAPGALEAMEERAADWAGTWLVDGAGHWVQQEQPDAVSARLLAFVRRAMPVRAWAPACGIAGLNCSHATIFGPLLWGKSPNDSETPSATAQLRW